MILWSAKGLIILTVFEFTANILPKSSSFSIPTQFKRFSSLAAFAYSSIGFTSLFLILFRCENAGIMMGELNFWPKISVVKSGSIASITLISTKIWSRKLRLCMLASSAFPLVTGIKPAGPGHCCFVWLSIIIRIFVYIYNREISPIDLLPQVCLFGHLRL